MVKEKSGQRRRAAKEEETNRSGQIEAAKEKRSKKSGQRKAVKEKSSQIEEDKDKMKRRAAKEGGGKPRPYGKLCRDFFTDQFVPNLVVHSLLRHQKLVMNFFFAARNQFPTIGSPQVAEHFPLN